MVHVSANAHRLSVSSPNAPIIHLLGRIRSSVYLVTAVLHDRGGSHPSRFGNCSSRLTATYDRTESPLLSLMAMIAVRSRFVARMSLLL